ncbi:MAG: sulfatase, partial [Acidimicrobiia bacterium]
MHVVMVCVDALRADHLGCYAGTDRGTPHMDRLAAEGVRFGNAVSQASWTHPSVASIMTGLYPSQHAMTAARQESEATKLTALRADLPTLPGCLRDAGFATAAFVAGNAYLKAEFGITRGFGHLDFQTTTDGRPVVDAFARWLEATGDGPSFAYLHLMDVHSPLPQELYPSRPMVDTGVAVDATEAGLETLLGYYAAGVRRADTHLGRVLSLLEERGRLPGVRGVPVKPGVRGVPVKDDTWVILTADHGEELNEHGVMLSHGQSLYRQLVWVPLVVRPPGGEGAGRAPAGPVSHIDLLPTILEAAGVAVPEVPGRSLLPLLTGDGSGDAAFSELLKRVRYSRSVTTSEHHFIETFHVSKAPVATISELRPGTSVEVKGQPVSADMFLPTKVTIGIPGSDKLLGLVESVEVPTGVVTVLGCAFHVDAGTELVGLDKVPFSLADLSVGDRVNVTLDPPGGGGRRARSVMWRKPGGESKLEGPLEAVEAAGDGSVTVRVMGWAVRIDPARERLVHRDTTPR